MKKYFLFVISVILETCIREIEARGLLEIGLYRIEGSHTEATELLNKLLTCKVSPPRLNFYVFLNGDLALPIKIKFFS